jgi:hypothetical protein
MTRPLAWAAALFAAAALTGCNNAAAVDIRNYDILLADQPSATMRADGVLQITINMIIGTDAGRVVGASLAYAVSAGELSDTTAFSGANGTASVTWTVTPAQAQGQYTLSFMACADNLDPPECTPSLLATLQPSAAP